MSTSTARGSPVIRTVLTGILTAAAIAMVLLFLVIATFAGLAAQASCLTVVNDPSTAYDEDDPKVAAARSWLDQFSEAGRAERLENVRVIVTEGANRQVTEHDMDIAVGTAMQETNLVNLPFQGETNDHCSIGLFQQQYCQGWGTPEQLMDPVYTTNKFYDALEQVPDRESRPMIEVAIDVQNPNPEAYYSRWAWDEIAPQLVSMFLDNDPRDAACYGGTSSDGWRSPMDPGYSITGVFGEPREYRNGIHEGVDLATSLGAPIMAAHAGTITSIGYNGGFGNQILLDNGDNIETSYNHMTGFADGLHEGSQVQAGQVIGYEGNTGTSFGAHLHFEVHVDGKPVDPQPFFEARGAPL